MDENDTPADILRIAETTAGMCVERPYNKGSMARATKAISRSLLAERLATEKRVREECAKVVECFIPASQDRLSEQIAELCAIIAATIRGGSHE